MHPAFRPLRLLPLRLAVVSLLRLPPLLVAVWLLRLVVGLLPLAVVAGLQLLAAGLLPPAVAVWLLLRRRLAAVAWPPLLPRIAVAVVLPLRRLQLAAAWLPLPQPVVAAVVLPPLLAAAVWLPPPLLAAVVWLPPLQRLVVGQLRLMLLPVGFDRRDVLESAWAEVPLLRLEPRGLWA